MQIRPDAPAPDVAREAFAEARQKILTREILSDRFERALWLAAFTGDLHVQVNSGMVVRCLWAERSGMRPSREQMELRRAVDPPRLSDTQWLAIPETFAVDNATGKVVSLAP